MSLKYELLRMMCHASGFKVVDLKQSRLWNKFLPKYFRQLSITLPGYILLSNKSLSTLAHEYAHVVQYREKGFFKFLLEYLSPQIYSLIPLLVGLALCCVGEPLLALYWLPVAVALAAPWRSKKRLEIETEGYVLTMAIEYWERGKVSDQTKENIVNALSGLPYYFMVSKKRAIKIVEELCIYIENDCVYFKAYEDVKFVCDTEVIRK